MAANDKNNNCIELLQINNDLPFIYVQFMQLCNIVLSTIYNISNEINISSSEVTRLRFLESTITKIKEFGSDFEEEINKMGSFVYFIERIYNSLKDLTNLLEQISEYATLLTHNFDIFEFKLRESLIELKTMFRIDEGNDNISKFICPSSVIENPRLKKLWEDMFGNDRYTINFNDFIKMIETYFGKNVSNETKLRLKYLANFPEGTRVSPFKINQLFQMFGEDDFVENIKYIDTQGFLGLMNRIEATELLTDYNIKNPMFLIRFSRTEPGYFAFSSIKNGKILHYVNKEKSTGRFIPVKEFIKSKFSNYEVFPRNLNYKVILSLGNLGDYSSGTGYIC
jgi:hypothetical protein